MKRILVLWGIVVLSLTVVASTSSAGEKADYGIKIGMNIANITGDVEDYVGPANSRTCMTIGAFVVAPSFGKFYLQPEFLYAQKGAKTDRLGATDVTLELSYIEIPILLKYRFNGGNHSGPNLYVGPAADLLLSSEVGTSDLKNYTMKVDGCLILGGGYDIAMGNGYLTLEGRYLYGLTTIADSEVDLDVKNRVFSIFVGYAF